MKNFLFLVFSQVVLICMFCRAQGQPYKKLSEFGKDTDKYVAYNFKIRRQQYIHQPFERLYKAIEIPVSNMLPEFRYQHRDTVNAVIIYTESKGETYSRTSHTVKGILVQFTDGFLRDDVVDAEKKGNLISFLENRVVKDIRLLGYGKSN